MDNSLLNNADPRPFMLSVVFSFRNEEDVLPELIRRMRNVLRKESTENQISSYELIFVNDASKDTSLEILLNHAKGYDDIRIINMSRRFGVAPCVLAGMKYSQGDAVVYMDADLQDPPEVIPELLKEYSHGGVEVVHTVRRSRRGESGIKLLITKIGYLILNKLTSIKLPIEAGDFKLLSRRAVEYVLLFKERRPFIRGLVCWIGFKQREVFYHRDARYAGETKFRVFSWEVFNNFASSALISFSSVPLRIASAMGLFAIFIDFAVMGHAFWEKFHGKAIPGWTALMIVILFIGGIQLFCVGIIGLYLNAVYENSKERPAYIIDSTIGFKQGND